jgi:FtsZ-binding cell division protein ZapB
MKYESRYHEKLQENQRLQKEVAELKERNNNDLTRNSSQHDSEKSQLVEKLQQAKSN